MVPDGESSRVCQPSPAAGERRSGRALQSEPTAMGVRRAVAPSKTCRRNPDARSRTCLTTATLFWLSLSVILGSGCDRPATVAGSRPASRPAGTLTVASLVPAATDLLIGMGLGDRLVGVSNFDQPRESTRGLPRVGDYRSVDWEQLATLRPTIMIVQFHADKMPAGLQERAEHYGIRLVNVRINRLDEIYATIDQLGAAVNEPVRATDAAVRLRRQLANVAASVAGKTPVRTLLSMSDNPLQAVGGGTFLDELLTIAGGRNVLSGPGYDTNSYPMLDREQLRSFKPDAVINLLPGASSQVRQQARDFWQGQSAIPAQQQGRVYYLTDDDLLWPGMNVGHTAERFAAVLHGTAANEWHARGPALPDAFLVGSAVPAAFPLHASRLGRRPSHPDEMWPAQPTLREAM